MNLKESRKRILAAQELLLGSGSLSQRLRSARALVKGIRPELDEMLEKCESEVATVENLFAGDILSLAADTLPEITEEEKKSKKVLVYFLEHWGKMKDEVSRVSNELAVAGNTDDKSQKQNHWGTILKHATGPLGLVTVIAVGIALLKTTSVDVVIQNKGCGTFEASKSMPIAIPGFSLPTGSIPSGSSATATLPPLTINVDGTHAGALAMKALSFTMTFGLPDNVTGVTLDGTSLLKKKTEIHLSDRKTHTLVLSCAG
jgi:hypothetical protein